MSRVVMAAAVVMGMAAVSLAQQSTTSETKSFEVLAVDGNQLDVRFPEGTREITVPEDFRFNINGQMMSVHQLKVGMKGTATITTRTTVTPVTVTEVKNGTVVVKSGQTIIVRTDEGVKSFSQGEVDKRGVKIWRDGKLAQVSDFREGDKLSATIVTSLPPKVMTEQEVQATLASNPAAARAATGASGGAAPARAGTAGASSGSSASRTSATPQSTQASAELAPRAGAAPAGGAGTLPHTASSRPLIGLTGLFFLAAGLTLTVRRRFVR
jgi:hypothetical protein